MEGPLPPKPVAAASSPFPSLPFLTDAYLPAPQSSAAPHQQLLLLQGTPADQTTAEAADRLSAAGAEGWADPSGAAALHLLGAPRDGDGGDVRSSMQDPSAFAASYFGSYLFSSPGISIDNPQSAPGGLPRSFLPTHSSASPETGSSSFVGSIPSGGFPLYSGTTFPCSSVTPSACGVTQEAPLGAPSAGSALHHENAMQDTQGFASDYDRLTKELGRYCANLRDLVTGSPSLADELNSTLETAIQSAGQVTRVQRKLLLSVNQQKQLVAESKLIQSKVHMLHRILQRTAPQYNQYLEEHAALREYIQQLEQQHRDPVGYGGHVGNENTSDNIRNCTISRSNSGSIRRRSTRQYKRQHLFLQSEPCKGFLLPAIKSEPKSSCS